MPFWLPAMAIASVAGKIMGGAAKGRADARAAEANLNTQRDRNEIDKYQTQQNAEIQRANLLNNMGINKAQVDLSRREFSEKAPLSRYQQALKGNMAVNMQDVTASHPRANVVHFGGGMRPSVIGPGGKAAGQELARQAMLRLMSGDKFDEISTVDPRLLKAPTATPMPKASWFDKLLGAGGMIGAGAGAGADIMNSMNWGLPKDIPGGYTGGLPGQVGTPIQDPMLPPLLNAKQLIFGNTPTL